MPPRFTNSQSKLRMFCKSRRIKSMKSNQQIFIMKQNLKKVRLLIVIMLRKPRRRLKRKSLKHHQSSTKKLNNHPQSSW